LRKLSAVLPFLDVFPLALGHTLVVPKQEIDYVFDVPDDLFTELHLFSKTIAKAIEKAVPCKRIGIAVIGLEVPHAHIHLVPLNHVSDINFERPKLSFPKEQMEDVCARIKAEVLSSKI
jgi:histidine triad (HIT) family protein